jgi:hypothetical protein
MKKMRQSLVCLAVAAVSVLAGCGGDSASYIEGGNRDTAFSLFRDKNYPGADWELALTLAHMPDCQRRHPLKREPSSKSYQADLYRTPDGGYTLRSGDTWYLAQLSTCSLQEAQSPPAAPGELLGSWQEGDSEFHFSPAGKP